MVMGGGCLSNSLTVCLFISAFIYLFRFVLFCFVLFCSVLFCFVLFCFMLVCLFASVRVCKAGGEGRGEGSLCHDITKQDKTTQENCYHSKK